MCFIDSICVCYYGFEPAKGKMSLLKLSVCLCSCGKVLMHLIAFRYYVRKKNKIEKEMKKKPKTWNETVFRVFVSAMSVEQTVSYIREQTKQ